MNAKALLAAAIAASVTVAAPQGALAQADYPSKPINWLVPSSAGSAFDVISRIITPKLSEILGQPVVIENVAGAGGTVGAAKAAQAQPDGYNVLNINNNHLAAESLYKNLSYDLIDSFDPVIRFVVSYHALVVRKDLEVQSVADLVAIAKAKPGELNIASAGIGSATFLCGELFKARAGTDIQHIPYEGGGPAMASIVAGETDVYCAPVATAKPFIDSGEVKALAVTSTKSLSLLPDLPPAAETVPDFEFTAWYGLTAPKGTPIEMRDKLRAGIVEAMADPANKAKFADLAVEPLDEGPEEFEAFLKKEVATTAELIEAAGIKPQ
jgi:tripartite-type tricarboxylate transporter receptor subunit TctC